MPLDEIALEELGLAPRWVRRGLLAQAGAAVANDVDGVAAEPVAPVAAVRNAQAVDPIEARATREPVAASFEATEPAASETARARSPQALSDGGAAAPGASMRAEPAASEPALTHSPQAPSDGGAAARSAPVPAEAAEAIEPAAEDDYAWFDDHAAPVGEPAPARAPTARDEISLLDWDALAAQVSECTRCRLCEKRTNTVFGVGDRAAEWMLIGEAPGENEDRVGEPFVGQAGKLLDNMLQALSLARGENVYIANVIKCRPPGNRNPEPDEVARCEPYLQRQVALVKPKLIVALGRFAAQSLLKTEGSIASLRGRVHEYEGVPVIVTYHPAYLLRSLHDKSKAWADLCLARDTWRAAGSGRG